VVMTKDEALKLALEALERCVATCFDPYAHEQAMSWSEHFVNQTITAIKEALAQPEQEPVAWRAWVSKFPQGTGSDWVYVTKPIMKDSVHNQPLYTTPPQRTWIGLTDEEIKALASWWPSYDQMPALMVLAKDIQNSLKEKNT
jgi:hypothetical protein